MECDPRFWQLLDVNPVFGYVKHLLCENPRLMTSELLIRQPNDDDPVAWHDDGPAYPSYRSHDTRTVNAVKGWLFDRLLGRGWVI